MKQKPAQALASMLIGYARVSTEDQDLRRQIEELKRAGCHPDHIYTDKKSGATMRRRGLEAALMDCRPGDVLVATDVDRLSRSIKDLINLSERLHSEGVELRIINKQIDTTTPMGRAFFHIMAMFAELERGMISERTKHGMAEAKRRGAKFGPVARFGTQHFNRAISMLQAGKSANEVGRHFGVTGQVVRDKLYAAKGKKFWKPRVKRNGR